MWSRLAGVPGKLSSLITTVGGLVTDMGTALTNLTSVLGKLPTSGRAVSDAVLDNTKIGYLDTPISSILTSPMLDNQSAAIPTGTFPTTSAKAIEANNVTSVAWAVGGVYFNNAATGSLVTVINYSGKGVVCFLAAGNYQPSGAQATAVKVTIDGVVVFNQTRTTNDFQVAIGALAEGATAAEIGAIAFEQVPFNSSFKLEISAASGTHGTVVKWRPTA